MSFLIFSLTLFLLNYFFIALSGRPLIGFLQRIGFTQFIREEGPSSHQSKQFTPTAGGIAFLISIAITAIGLLIFSLLQKQNIAWSKCSIVGLTLLASAAIGFWDDYLKKVRRQNEGLKPKQKLTAQIALSIFLAFSLSRTNTNFFGFDLELGIWLFCIFVFLVLAGSMNAANLTDGLDGLAASVIAWSYLGLGALIFLKNPAAIESIAWCCALAGLCFGFLQINGHPAKVFMGDTGSFLLGGTLAVLALLNGLEWYLLVLAIVPIGETLSVMLQVLSAKMSRRFFGRDWRPFKMSPFHHHLEMCGWSEKKIVLVLSSCQALINIALCLFQIIH